MDITETATSVTPLVKADPRPRRSGGVRGGTEKTVLRRNQLKANPNEWFIWKENAKTGGDTGQVLRTLLGATTLKCVDRNTLPFEATARLNEDGQTWTIFVRYVEGRETASF